MIVDPTMRLARRAVDQRAQIMLGPRDRYILEHIAAGIHQRNHRSGERLAERDGGAHRHQRDCINAEAAGQEIASHRDAASPAMTGMVAKAKQKSATSGRPFARAAMPRTSPAVAIETSVYRSTPSRPSVYAGMKVRRKSCQTSARGV
jgi:hypothetical protein